LLVFLLVLFWGRSRDTNKPDLSRDGMGKLADTFVRQVKHKGAAAEEKYSDGEGLYPLIKASGKYWR